MLQVITNELVHKSGNTHNSTQSGRLWVRSQVAAGAKDVEFSSREKSHLFSPEKRSSKFYDAKNEEALDKLGLLSLLPVVATCYLRRQPVGALSHCGAADTDSTTVQVTVERPPSGGSS